MAAIQISLFGRFRIFREEEPAEVKATHTIQILFAYLLLERHRCHSREVLAGLFWGDLSQDQARHCLNTALWRLRRVLEPELAHRGDYLLTTPVGEVGFNCDSDHWLDVAAFEAPAIRLASQPGQAIQPGDVQALEQSLTLYKGELLTGFYDDWVLRERERLRLLHLSSLACLMQYYKQQGAYEESLAYGQQILSYDPLREEIHRELMRLHLQLGQRALAVRQYEACREVLAVELGIAPMPETQALYEQIAGAVDHHPATVGVIGPPLTLQQALNQLQQARRRFDEAQKRLNQAIQMVEQLTRSQ